MIIIMRSSATREARALLMILLGRVRGVDGCSQQDVPEASVARLLAICRHGHLCRPLPGGSLDRPAALATIDPHSSQTREDLEE